MKVEPPRSHRKLMDKGRPLVAVLVAGIVLALSAWAFQYFGVGGWEGLAGIAGTFFFAFFAILIGAVTKKLALSVIGSAAITALVMAFVYPLFAIIMTVVFFVSLGLKALDVYSEEGSGYGY